MALFENLRGSLQSIDPSGAWSVRYSQGQRFLSEWINGLMPLPESQSYWMILPECCLQRQHDPPHMIKYQLLSARSMIHFRMNQSPEISDSRVLYTFEVWARIISWYLSVSDHWKIRRAVLWWSFSLAVWMLESEWLRDMFLMLWRCSLGDSSKARFLRAHGT